MEEEDLYEAMGLEVPATEEDPPESHEDEAESVTEGQPSQEDGDGGGEVPTAPEGGTEDQQAGVSAPVGGAEQYQHEIANLEAERARAQQAAIDQAYAAACAGKLNPYTGRPITTKAEFDEYQGQMQADQQRQRMEQLRRAGVDTEAIQAIIDQHPVVQQAQAAIQQAQVERERAQTTQALGWYGEQLKAINALDPDAKLGSLEDLAARDPAQYRSMLGMVAGGASLADAYKALNFDTLAQKRAAAAKQAVLNQAAGKGHLVPSAGQGKAGLEVPGDIREMYRDMGLELSDAEISKSYAEYLKQTGQ